MFVAKVTGSIVSTQKVPTMVGQKLLVVEPYRIEAKQRSSMETTGRTFIAVDTVGAGEGEMVLITQGSSARMTPQTEKLPVDAVIVGIVDTVHMNHQCVFRREEPETETTNKRPG
jgi:ethanolamine utilization protein EutN